MAEGGSLFLDEIGELTPNMQAKLLRVLETVDFRRVGGTQKPRSDIRILAATNRDPCARVKEGKFRADLYHRVSTVLIHVPPLRERREDVAMLAESLLKTRPFKRANKKRLGKDAIDRLIQRTKVGGGEIVKLLKTGSAYYSPAMSSVQMVESIVRDKKRIVPAAALLQGEYGLSDVYVGVPVKLGSEGVEEIVELKLTSEELGLLKNSAEEVTKGIKDLNL